MYRRLLCTLLCVCSLVVEINARDKTSSVSYTMDGITNRDRFHYAIELLQHELEVSSLTTKIEISTVGQHSSLPDSLKEKLVNKEHFIIYRKSSKGAISLIGMDESGVLYGCMTLLAHRQWLKGEPFFFADGPKMVMRGTSVGLQKTTYLPGHDIYEYPYTPESFPWFYDKKLWLNYLDMMAENRYNALYLWNGHPFSSLVKLKDYPYALEVDEGTFGKNEEIYTFLTKEANKRGIWIIQMFYNIILPKPFADRHGLKTQERNRVITPLISDYTRKSIAAFVAKYPNVGLLITLGEAMEGVGQDDVNWFTKTIIPGVQDGLHTSGISVEPPIILRAHDTDAPAVMEAALPIYKNLYTMAKYNGEALTTYTPRGKWAELHRSLSAIGTVHIQNVHILANLEPFRYGSPDFIQKSVKAMHGIHHSNGIHIYPQASYWDWPYSADKVANRLLQQDRDWMWYKAWARYAWDENRDLLHEQSYWSKELAQYYGISETDAQKLLLAIEEIGEISPKILRRFGITDGNRQTSSLGMLMTQLINPYRYGLFTLLYESEAPAGEMIVDYVEKDDRHETHVGETPVQVAKEIVQHGERALTLISGLGKPTKNVAEFNRWLQDIRIHHLLANHYSCKVKAAIQLLQYKYTHELNALRKALPDLEKSVLEYRKLTEITNESYLYANSMQTKQRKIPMRGADATFIHWNEMLPVFETELNNFKHAIDSLSTRTGISAPSKEKLKSQQITFEDRQQLLPLKKGAKLYADQELVVTHMANELEGLQALQIDAEKQKLQGTQLRFKNERAVKILVGYYNSTDKVFAPKPVLEIDASANDFGQAETKVRNAIRIQYMPMVDIHTYSFPPGTNELKIPKGEVLILGIVDDKELQNPYNADVDNQGDDLDDLFGYYRGTKL
ncbi:hypothetical protein K2F45_24995 [Sphingobacterium siyangense]|uniref:alpha-d-galacturonidase n=1 Tax=Sphingobacterium siyangense TaxID=459529 RepID=UPI00200F3E2E|nr:hypothetical protein [Sphingobacterium siyangense]UQA74995.1 hypothetical protein K2F45_24995 [Sphingobacterium siyangense]